MRESLFEVWLPLTFFTTQLNVHAIAPGSMSRQFFSYFVIIIIVRHSTHTKDEAIFLLERKFGFFWHISGKMFTAAVKLWNTTLFLLGIFLHSHNINLTLNKKKKLPLPKIPWNNSWINFEWTILETCIHKNWEHNRQMTSQVHLGIFSIIFSSFNM